MSGLAADVTPGIVTQRAGSGRKDIGRRRLIRTHLIIRITRRARCLSRTRACRRTRTWAGRPPGHCRCHPPCRSRQNRHPGTSPVLRNLATAPPAGIRNHSVRCRRPRRPGHILADRRAGHGIPGRAMRPRLPMTFPLPAPRVNTRTPAAPTTTVCRWHHTPGLLRIPTAAAALAARTAISRLTRISAAGTRTRTGTPTTAQGFPLSRILTRCPAVRLGIPPRPASHGRHPHRPGRCLR